MAAYWPRHAPSDDMFAVHLNTTRKYVVSRTLRSSAWQNLALIEGDVTAAMVEQSESGCYLTAINRGDCGSSTPRPPASTASCSPISLPDDHSRIFGSGAELVSGGGSELSLPTIDAKIRVR